ncbi:MAG: hypothetical protein WC856_13670 [Methylococcaceae bacterium]|jgi:hypothetical protein
MSADYTDYILELPAPTKKNELPAITQAIIDSLGSEWPEFPMVGTQEVANKALLHVRMKTLKTKAELDALFVGHSLPWAVKSIRKAFKETNGVDANGDPIIDYKVEHAPIKNDLLKYMNDIFTGFDVNGNPVFRKPMASDAIFLSTYAGTEPIQL